MQTAPLQACRDWRECWDWRVTCRCMKQVLQHTLMARLPDAPTARAARGGPCGTARSKLRGRVITGAGHPAAQPLASPVWGWPADAPHLGMMLVGNWAAGSSDLTGSWKCRSELPLGTETVRGLGALCWGGG